MSIDFGDEFVIESYKIPWLIWIQILVLLLLFLLLCCFSIFATNSDLCNQTTTIDCKASSSTSVVDVSSSKPFREKKVNTSYAANKWQHSQIVENRSINGQAATRASRRRVTEANPTETESSSSKEKDTIHNNLHPCNYFRLAKIAFLKCLGLDPSSERNSSSDQKWD